TLTSEYAAPPGPAPTRPHGSGLRGPCGLARSPVAGAVPPPPRSGAAHGPPVREPSCRGHRVRGRGGGRSGVALGFRPALGCLGHRRRAGAVRRPAALAGGVVPAQCRRFGGGGLGEGPEPGERGPPRRRTGPYA